MYAWWIELSNWAQSGLVVAGAVVLYLGLRVVVLSRLDRLASNTDNDLDDRLVLFARQFAGIVLGFLTLLAVLHIHEVAISPFLAGAGIAGIALAFAAKEVLGDILAGVFLIADRPMRIGDRVKIENIGSQWGSWGDVVDIGLRRTTVRNTDGVIVNYPNHLLANSVITNFSFERGPVRVRVRFHVARGVDIEHVRSIAADAVRATEGVIQETVEVVARAMWDESRGHLNAGILMEARYRIADVRARTRIRSAVIVALEKALADADVPYSSPLVTVRNAPD